jgi:hypothetical protein
MCDRIGTPHLASFVPAFTWTVRGQEKNGLAGLNNGPL